MAIIIPVHIGYRNVRVFTIIRVKLKNDYIPGKIHSLTKIIVVRCAVVSIVMVLFN